MSDHQPIEPEYIKFMNDFARGFNMVLKNHFGPDMGFFLGMFKTGDASRFNYISNCEREDVIKLLDEMSAKFKKDIQNGPPSMGG